MKINKTIQNTIFKNNKILSSEIKKFIIRYSVIASVVIWIIGSHIKDFNEDFINSLIKPFFSIDLDQNGEPDFQQLGKLSFKLGPFSFPIGKIIYALLKLILELSMIYAIVYLIIKYTDIIKI